MKRYIAIIISCLTTTGWTYAQQPAQHRADKIIADVKSQFAPDKRQAVFDINAAYRGDSTVALIGTTSEAAAHDALFEQLSRNGIKAYDLVTVLPDTLWAMPRISVAHGRVNPAHSAEIGTQAIMGMPLRLLEKRGDWWHVQTPDGYLSWIVDNSLVHKSQAQMAQWRATPRLVVTSLRQTQAYNSAKGNGPRDIVTDLVNGNIVEGSMSGAVHGRVPITLPDGRLAWVDKHDVEPLDKWAAQNFNAEHILDMAYSMEGSPYFWGGTSVKNLDCSGLAKVSYLYNGIILMRDASQQALTGTRIEPSRWPECQAGDLLFFGDAKTKKVTHVAIYDHDGNYVHSSGQVKRNSVDPQSPDYLTTPFLHAVRINGNEGTPGITYVRNHPWYF